MAIAFPPVGAFPLAWVAMVPALLVCRRLTLGRTMSLGCLFGIAFYGGVFWWIPQGYCSNGAPWWQGGLCLLLVAGWFTLTVAVPFMACYGRLTRYDPLEGGINGAMGPLVSAALWVLLEYAATHVADAFAAGILGYSQWRFLEMIQVASLFGAGAVSFLIVAANAALAAVAARWSMDRPAALRSAVPAGLLLAASLAYGTVRLGRGSPTAGRPLEVAVLQADADTLDPGAWEENYGRYKRLAREASRSGASLIVWPESAVPPTESLENELHDMRRFARETAAWHLFGAVRRQGDSYRNSAVLMDQEGRTAGVYDKVALMPFGESMPFEFLLRRFLPVLGGIKTLEAGIAAEPLGSPWGPLGVSICFEIAHQEHARVLARRGSRLLVNLSNEVWFRGLPTVSELQNMMAVFRALESGLPLLRAANAGSSVVIDPLGRTRAISARGKPGFLRCPVPPAPRPSLYVRHGEGPWWCLLLGLIAIGAFGRLSRTPPDLGAVYPQIRTLSRKSLVHGAMEAEADTTS